VAISHTCFYFKVNKDGRPFMGPNIYLTPPGSFTQFHQDGHGSADSGHLCLEGFNEVVMLRRLDDVHKEHALHFLKCNERRQGSEIKYDALYGKPHHDVSNHLNCSLRTPSLSNINLLS
jgi:hypothetical protein